MWIHNTDLDLATPEERFVERQRRNDRVCVEELDVSETFRGSVELVAQDGDLA